MAELVHGRQSPASDLQTSVHHRYAAVVEMQGRGIGCVARQVEDEQQKTLFEEAAGQFGTRLRIVQADEIDSAPVINRNFAI